MSNLIISTLTKTNVSSTHIESMLNHSKTLVLGHQQRYGRRRIYAPQIKWSKWFYTGGEEEEALPTNSRRAIRQGNSDECEDDEADMEILDDKEGLLDTRRNMDLENMGGFNQGHAEIAKANESAYKIKSETRQRLISENISTWIRLRIHIADTLEWVQQSDDVLYAFKLTVAVFLVLWPAFVASWNTWYSLNRGCEQKSNV